MPTNMNDLIRSRAGVGAPASQRDQDTEGPPTVPELLEQLQTVVGQLVEQLAESDKSQARRTG